MQYEKPQFWQVSVFAKFFDWLKIGAPIATVSTALVYALLWEVNLKSEVNTLERKLDLFTLSQARAAAWTGKWTGKWNNTWDVQFIIWETVGDKYFVEYSHQNTKNGPIVDNGLFEATLDGDTLYWGRQKLVRKIDGNSLEAIGVFIQGTSVTAELHKVSIYDN